MKAFDLRRCLLDEKPRFGAIKMKPKSKCKYHSTDCDIECMECYNHGVQFYGEELDTVIDALAYMSTSKKWTESKRKKSRQLYNECLRAKAKNK